MCSCCGSLPGPRQVCLPGSGGCARSGPTKAKPRTRWNWPGSLSTRGRAAEAISSVRACTVRPFCPLRRLQAIPARPRQSGIPGDLARLGTSGQAQRARSSPTAPTERLKAATRGEAGQACARGSWRLLVASRPMRPTDRPTVRHELGRQHIPAAAGRVKLPQLPPSLPLMHTVPDPEFRQFLNGGVG